MYVCVGRVDISKGAVVCVEAEIKGDVMIGRWKLDCLFLCLSLFL